MKRFPIVVAVIICFAGVFAVEPEGIAVAPQASVKLADGFVVANGSRLVGTVFRSAVTPTGGSEWAALLLVGDDPMGVYDAYVTQARTLGFPLSGSAAGPGGSSSCHWDGFDRNVPYDGTTVPNATAFECSSSVTVQGGGSSRFVSLLVRWGGPTRHAYLTVSRTPATGVAATPDFGDARAQPPPTLPAVTRQRLPSKAGTPFGAPNDGYYLDYPRPRLEAGSRVAAPQAFTIGNDDFVTVLRVDRDLDTVLKRYLRQLGGGETVLRRGTTVQGDRIAYFNTSPDGGGAGSMLGDPTGRWLLARTNSD